MFWSLKLIILLIFHVLGVKGQKHLGELIE